MVGLHVSSLAVCLEYGPRPASGGTGFSSGGGTGNGFWFSVQFQITQAGAHRRLAVGFIKKLGGGGHWPSERVLLGGKPVHLPA